MGTRQAAAPGLRIGEVARRAGMTPGTLRSWELRYGFLAPARTAGGHRLYRETDVTRVKAVRDLVNCGWSVAGAVSHVLGQPGNPEGTVADGPAGAAQRTSRDRPAAPGLPPSSRARWRLLDCLQSVDAATVAAAYETVRDMLRASEPGEVRDALVALVQQLGGQVGEAALQDDTVIPVDLALGEGPPLLPRAPSHSVARMRLEAVLPLVVEDARVLAHRLQLSPAAGTARPSGATVLT